MDGMPVWRPAKDGLELECRIGLRSYPVAGVWAFFSDDGEPPIDGALTGTMSLEGTIAELRGHGSIALRGANVAGEPIESASFDIEFAKGAMHARRILVQLAAGRFEGEGSYDIAANRFSYAISSPGIELGKLKGWPDLEKTLDGTVVVSSRGSGR